VRESDHTNGSSLLATVSIPAMQIHVSQKPRCLLSSLPRPWSDNSRDPLLEFSSKAVELGAERTGDGRLAPEEVQSGWAPCNPFTWQCSLGRARYGRIAPSDPSPATRTQPENLMGQPVRWRRGRKAREAVQRLNRRATQAKGDTGTGWDGFHRTVMSASWSIPVVRNRARYAPGEVPNSRTKTRRRLSGDPRPE
jgi:hypothetical protein